jgi:iduronate 2-sulfatase
MRNICILVVSTFAVLHGHVQAQTAQRKPNVLFIVSDDLRIDLGCYGAPVQTPNIDALAKRGVRMERAYCQYPLCGPSRCSFLSGLRPDTTGVLQNGLPVRHKIKDLITLPQLFRQNGYVSMRVGKLYHLNIPDGVGTPGPDDPESWDSTFNPKGAEFSKDGDEYNPNVKDVQSFRRVILDGDGHEQADYQSADEAIRLLRENREKPFFLAVGFIRPHVPELAPKKYFDLYPLEKIEVPKVPSDDRDDKPALAFQHSKPDFGMDERGIRESIRAYHATTSFMDAQVGRVIDELDKLGLAENTIITFISDHGYLLGQHHEWQKMTLFEETCKVPVIVAAPGMKERGVTARGLVESVDFYPTIAELAGLKTPGTLEGKSFVPLLNNAKGSGKSEAFTQVWREKRGGTGRSVRTEQYRYTEWNEGKDGAELYDEENDPAEVKNLAKNSGSVNIVADMKKRLHAHWPTTQPGGS